jgi:hypothetical protein
MREKITQLTRDTACMSCHSVINPLGFALENFDAVGRWRQTDKNKPLDTKGTFVTDDGSAIEFASALDIARFAATSESGHRAFVRQLFHHLTKNDPAAYGSDVLESLRREFEASNCNIQTLMVRIAVLVAGHGGRNSHLSNPS